MDRGVLVGKEQKLTARQLVQYLDEEIARGKASADTIANYTSQLKLYVQWCDRNGIAPLAATEENLKTYRRYLVKKNYQISTIATKLTIVRKLYGVLVGRGLIASNPVLRVKPPVERKEAGTNNNYLSKTAASELISYLPEGESLAALRDRLLVALLLKCAARQVELHRLTMGDIVRRNGQVGLKFRSKRSVRVVPLTEDLDGLLACYLKALKQDIKDRLQKLTAREREMKESLPKLKARSEDLKVFARVQKIEESLRKLKARKLALKLKDKTPIFISLASNHYGQPLSRRAIQSLGKYYLDSLKQSDRIEDSESVTVHGCRHTGLTLLAEAGQSLLVIQKFAGHADPKTTAIYTHTVNLWKNNPIVSMGLVV